MTPFLDVLYKLSHETGLKLYPDSHDACNLLVADNIHIQLEMSPGNHTLCITSIITEIPLGKFRENVLKCALVANSAEYPYYGYLCFIKKLNSLALYDLLPLHHLTGESLIKYISEFTHKVKRWRDAIQQGQPGPDLLRGPVDKHPPMFGVKS